MTTEDEALFERVELASEVLPGLPQMLCAFLVKPEEDQAAVHLVLADIVDGRMGLRDSRPMFIPLAGVDGVLAMARQALIIVPHLSPESFDPDGVAVLVRDDVLVSTAIKAPDGETHLTLGSADGEAICAVPARHAGLFVKVLEEAQRTLAEMGLAHLPARAAN